MSKKPTIPNQIPSAYKKYKEKSGLKDIEIAKKINSLITDPRYQLTITTNPYEKEVPASTYYSYFNPKNNTRPKNIQQRSAILEIIGLPYSKSVFANAQDIINFYKKVYDYEMQQLQELCNKPQKFTDKMLLTEANFKEPLKKENNYKYSQLSDFTLGFILFLKSFDTYLGLPIGNDVEIERLSSSNYFLTLNKLLVSHQISKKNLADNLLKSIEDEKEVIKTVLKDMEDYRDDFFSTFKPRRIAEDPVMLQDCPPEFEYEQVEKHMENTLEGLAQTKDENSALVYNASDDIKKLFYLLCDSFEGTHFIKFI